MRVNVDMRVIVMFLGCKMRMCMSMLNAVRVRYKVCHLFCLSVKFFERFEV